MKRDYPPEFVEKTTAIVKYKDRRRYLKPHNRVNIHIPKTSVYKLVPPPQYTLLKQLVLKDYSTLRFMCPRFIPLKHPTLQNKLVQSQIRLADSQFVLALTLDCTTPPRSTESSISLPRLRPLTTTIKACNHPRCVTCKVHLKQFFDIQIKLPSESYSLSHLPLFYVSIH